MSQVNNIFDSIFQGVKSQPPVDDAIHRAFERGFMLAKRKALEIAMRNGSQLTAEQINKLLLVRK